MSTLRIPSKPKNSEAKSSQASKSSSSRDRKRSRDEKDQTEAELETADLVAFPVRQRKPTLKKPQKKDMSDTPAEEKPQEMKKALQTPGMELLTRIRTGLDKTPFHVWPITAQHYYDPKLPRRLVEFTVLFKNILQNEKLTTEACKKLVNELVVCDAVADRCAGALTGLAIGDAVGAPLEFIPCDSSLPPYKRKMTRSDTGRAAWVDPFALNDKGQLNYPDEYNKFRLLRGQWTDDASMAFAMAESMLVKGGYNGSDVRIRYFCWWYYGYCNAFRFDSDDQRTSVGLGGNISKSIDDLMRFPGADASKVPANYEASGEDAGNGSIMRLAPVPIRYHTDINKAMKMAEESSLATHPGPDAAVCCRFMTYFIVKAIHRDETTASATAGQYLDSIVASFLAEHAGQEKTNTGMAKLFQLLNCSPPSDKEACWDWKQDRMLLEETIKARGSKYNGYPVMPGYFGSYCMDGLAMALWALAKSDCFTDCIFKVVNLLGDCDTTGAIAGQMAGAFYGYTSIASNDFGKRMLEDIHRWDRAYEIELRALCLNLDAVAEASSQ